MVFWKGCNSIKTIYIVDDNIQLAESLKNTLMISYPGRDIKILTNKFLEQIRGIKDKNEEIVMVIEASLILNEEDKRYGHKGMEVIKIIRQELRQRYPVIITSIDNEENFQNRHSIISQTPGHYFLRKPFLMSDLNRILDEAKPVSEAELDKIIFWYCGGVKIISEFLHKCRGRLNILTNLELFLESTEEEKYVQLKKELETYKDALEDLRLAKDTFVLRLKDLGVSSQRIFGDTIIDFSKIVEKSNKQILDIEKEKDLGRGLQLVQNIYDDIGNLIQILYEVESKSKPPDSW